MITMDEHRQVIDHVMRLINQPTDGSGEISKTLAANNVETIIDLVNLRSTVHDIFYKVGSKKIELTAGHRNLLVIVSHYNMARRKNGATFRVLDWLTVDQDHFDEFRLDYDANDYLPSASTNASGATTVTTSLPTSDPLRDFNRGIKRDVLLFPELKDNKQWDSWYIQTKAQARAQNVEIILDPTYKPSTIADVAIHDQRQKYMYSVFAKILQTDKGKALVRKHEDDYDAQAIHKELFEHAQRSTKASVDASDLLAYITTSRLGTGLWEGSKETFIIHWQNQIRKYEQLVKFKEYFSDSVK